MCQKEKNSISQDDNVHSYEFNTSNQKALEMRVSELKEKIETVEVRYGLGEIERPIFEKVFGKLKVEKTQIEEELEKTKIKLSDPSDLIDFTVTLSTKLYEIWHKGNFTQKRNFQKMLFPEGVQYDKKNKIIEPQMQTPCSLQSLKCQGVMRKIKSGVTIFQSVTPLQYPEGVPIAIGMNPHTLRHTPLKRTCLPPR